MGDPSPRGTPTPVIDPLGGARPAVAPAAEWLEADGLGGFASGTVSGVRTRRYHALLLSAAHPPAGRLVLVNGFDALVRTPGGTSALSSQRYAPDTLSPDGSGRLVDFRIDPWPIWRYRIEQGIEVEQELFSAHGLGLTVLRIGLRAPSAGVRLELRPFLSGRDYHALHHENPVFRFEPAREGERVRFAPYPGIPEITFLTNGGYRHEPFWYRSFLYEEERSRGLDYLEDLAAPGLFDFDLSAGPAVLIIGSSLSNPAEQGAAEADGRRRGARGDGAAAGGALESYERLASRERDRRARFETPLHRSADAYLVRRDSGGTIVAGYPWFTDWGRDTFISLRGLCLATGRLEEAAAILLQWAAQVSDGMLPNFFPDADRPPEFNSVDASLWFIVAVYELLKRARGGADREGGTGSHLLGGGGPRAGLDDAQVRLLWDAIEAILVGYSAGTRYGIGLDPGDGLLRAGEPGVQLTWMDAKVGDWVVTPRIGKPVEVQALWINALEIGSRRGTAGDSGVPDEPAAKGSDAAARPALPGAEPPLGRWAALAAQARDSFERRFWNEARGSLYDVVDVDHRAGEVDSSVRPNQILAVGGLPFPLLSDDRARRVVERCEEMLLTPEGLRSLAPREPGYAPHYAGGPTERDAAYHQGTVWPWLIGPFVEAWLRVQGRSAEAKAAAARRFIAPIEEAMWRAGGIGHLSEIADAEAPYTLRGCPFQAWSLGELLRVKLELLAPGAEAPASAAAPRSASMATGSRRSQR